MYLRCHSWFSFRYGTMSVEALLGEAQQKGITRMALTDINNTSGCLDFIRLAKNKYGISPAVGIDFRNPGNNSCYVGLAHNQQGFFALNRFLSTHLASGKAFPTRAPRLEAVSFIYPLHKAPEDLQAFEYRGVAPADLLRYLRRGKRSPCDVAFPAASFRHRKDFNAHRLLRAIAGNTLLSKLDPVSQGQIADVLHTEAELLQLYQTAPFLLSNAARLLEHCSIEMTFGKSKNKKHFSADTATDIEQLRSLCQEGVSVRYQQSTPIIRERINHELDLISRQGFAAYFLINWDIVRYARSQQYFYVGRGSGANSLVAYLLGITNVDPLELDLYFERFLNEHRANPPDFDIDFSWKDRDAIIAYIFRKYTPEHTALLATYSTFQENAVLRELGKVFGLPKAEIDRLSESEASDTDQITRLIFLYSKYLYDFPSHLSIHAGGILISEAPIHCYTATSMPPKGFPTTQFSMLEAEDLGLYKFDILSQRGLGHIKDATELISLNRNQRIDIHAITKFKKDPAIKELLRHGRTMGCFYVESPAMRMLLRKLRAEEYPDLVAASSIIRPGVARSGMMREYILRFRHPERRQYVHPMMKELMQETFGIMVYQEDVIKVAHYFAGLSLAEADYLRRGMSGKFRGREEFSKARDAFMKGCKNRGYTEQVTSEVWRQIESFAGYSFSKGHSASYAVESYQSLYLKAHYPLEFMVGVINNFGGFYRTEYYVHEARMAGGIIQAPCVNNSFEQTSIRGNELFLGFNLMADMQHKTIVRLVKERQRGGRFRNLADFVARVEITLEQLRLLIRIGAFRFTGRSKKQLLWDVLSLLGHERRSNPGPELFEHPQSKHRLPTLSTHRLEDAHDELMILGFPLCSPFELLPEQANKPDGLHAADLNAYIGQNIEITGYYVCRKPTRTVRGETMYFASFLDRQGAFFDTTHFPPVAARFPFRGHGCYLLKGKVVVEFDCPSLEVSQMEKLIPQFEKYR